MSSIVIKGNTSGQVEIAAPDVAGSTTLTLPTGTVLLSDGDGSQLTNLPQPASLSTASGSAPSYSARAWVNFNGTGTVAIRGSANVSSITDNGTGNYDVNFTTAMADTNYATTASGSAISGMATSRDVWIGTESEATGHTTINAYRYGGSTQIDITHCYVAIFR